MVPASSPEGKELLATANLSLDRAMLEESIVKLFHEAFDIDIRTCTEGEWAERITIEGGTLKQWQIFTKK